MSKNRGDNSVVVTGLGAITPLGHSVDELWDALLEGQCATQHWPDLEAGGFRIAHACRVRNFTTPDTKRGQMLAIASAREAMTQAALSNHHRVGIYIGSTMGESAAFEQAAEGALFELSQSTIQVFPKAIQQDLDLQGPTIAYGCACAAGNYAIGSAAQAIRSGEIDYAIAGGVEPFSKIAMLGFSRSRAMTSDYCRPFDAERSGMQLGEGAAMLILESEATALKRGVTPLAKIGPLGLTCDAYHPTAPRPDGSGMAAAMAQALATANLAPEMVDWVCAHGSGTRASDAAETLALQNTFPHRPAITALKGALGHALGASTAIQAVVAIQSLQKGLIPATINFRTSDSESALDIATKARQMTSLKRLISCGYAFGGINSALIMEVI